MTGDVVWVLGLVAAASLAALVMVVLLWRSEHVRARSRIEAMLRDQERQLAEARRDSLQRSRSTLKGQIAEQMAPMLEGFRYLPADARFLGDPIDYVVFHGSTEARDRGAEAGLEIVLLEIKQGSSALSSLQRLVARSVEEGRVRFEVARITDEGVLSAEVWRPRRVRLP